MKIEMHTITVRELVAGYLNSDEDGVVAFGGKLDVRPKYQREFIYKPQQQEAVIDTLTKGYPLNVMYWAVREDGTYEVIDGQQRTLSICEYVAGRFAYMFRYFGNLAADEQNEILDYGLTVYFCEGTESEKLEWFKTINIAGEELTEQELLNAVYAGPWTADLKRYFSRSAGPAFGLGSRYMKGEPIRQDYLATVLKWKSCGDVKNYMALHQHEPSAMEEWLYFKSIIDWVQTLFPKYRKEMKGLEWGNLYNEFAGGKFDPVALEKSILALMEDDDVQKKSGIYEYLLSGRDRERLLNIRAFTPGQKRAAYERQKGICPKCGKHFAIEEMEGDHIVPWSKGGKTVPENLQMLCRRCNGLKSDR
ncbi:MAG: DUF262 domain-containing protein [Kiritimatiellae bacterium]|nr:DUF262 domain-containing protein [Kiritimatiellia bacterium]